MDQSLYKFLVLNGHLSIPQLGSFNVVQEAAYIDSTSGFIFPPKPAINFTEGEFQMSEKLFFDFLSNEIGLDDVSAIKQFHEFAAQFRNELDEKKQASLKGVGVISKGVEGNLTFEPATDLSILLPALPLNESILSGVSGNNPDKSTEKDYWWFYAIILMILGIGALAYYII
jgi:hypothetical protein